MDVQPLQGSVADGKIPGITPQLTRKEKEKT
jgi:hypothetical protein